METRDAIEAEPASAATPAPANAPAPAPAKKKGGGIGETTRFLIILFVIAVIVRSFVIAPFSIPSGSMLPRMMIGDYLFVAKWPYGFSRYSFPFGLASYAGRLGEGQAERGDVVVFRYPGGEDVDFVKRVIGLPGDQVQVRGGVLYLNGEAVPKVRIADYLMPISPNTPCRTIDPAAARIVAGPGGQRSCAYPRYRETLPGGRSYEVLDQIEGVADDTQVYVVPEDHYFVMGDNRDDSEDSRFPRDVGGVGFLPEDYLIGRALVTFFSTDGSASLVLPWTWFSAARWERVGGTY
jgi:signal peptidase I